MDNKKEKIAERIRKTEEQLKKLRRQEAEIRRKEKEAAEKKKQKWYGELEAMLHPYLQEQFGTEYMEVVRQEDLMEMIKKNLTQEETGYED